VFNGDEYQARFDRLAAEGSDVHGEAAFVDTLDPRPRRVLDAGCGTGRVAIELARRGIDVVGVDVDAGMLAVARRAAPELAWIEHDLATLDLGPETAPFDVAVMAGNVMIFVAPGTEADVVAHIARHVRPGGAVVAGFQLKPGAYDLSRYDADCSAAGLALSERYATWDRRPFVAGPDADYAVSVHRSDA
jgi:2-polyprenyl-3-methyl-5-hydroxy-6-metoxy-1,4-benzoquinol methylase